MTEHIDAADIRAIYLMIDRLQAKNRCLRSRLKSVEAHLEAAERRAAEAEQKEYEAQERATENGLVLHDITLFLGGESGAYAEVLPFVKEKFAAVREEAAAEAAREERRAIRDYIQAVVNMFKATSGLSVGVGVEQLGKAAIAFLDRRDDRAQATPAGGSDAD